MTITVDMTKIAQNKTKVHIHKPKHVYTEMELLAFSRNFRHWMYRKLSFSKRTFSVGGKKLSKWHNRFDFCADTSPSVIFDQKLQITTTADPPKDINATAKISTSKYSTVGCWKRMPIPTFACSNTLRVFHTSAEPKNRPTWNNFEVAFCFCIFTDFVSLDFVRMKVCIIWRNFNFDVLVSLFIMTPWGMSEYSIPGQFTYLRVSSAERGHIQISLLLRDAAPTQVRLYRSYSRTHRTKPQIVLDNTVSCHGKRQGREKHRNISTHILTRLHSKNMPAASFTNMD